MCIRDSKETERYKLELLMNQADLTVGGFAADRIVHDAVACHVHAHVRGGLIRAFAGDQLKHGVDVYKRQTMNLPLFISSANFLLMKSLLLVLFRGLCSLLRLTAQQKIN